MQQETLIFLFMAKCEKVNIGHHESLVYRVSSNFYTDSLHNNLFYIIFSEVGRCVRPDKCESLTTRRTRNVPKMQKLLMGDKIATHDGEVNTVLINDRFELNKLLEDGQVVDYENLHLHEEAEGDDADEERIMIKRSIESLADENGIVKKKARAKYGETQTREAVTGEKDEGKEKGRKPRRKGSEKSCTGNSGHWKPT